MEMDFRRSGGQITTIPVYKVHPQLTLPGQGWGGGRVGAELATNIQ